MVQQVQEVPIEVRETKQVQRQCLLILYWSDLRHEQRASGLEPPKLSELEPMNETLSSKTHRDVPEDTLLLEQAGFISFY